MASERVRGNCPQQHHRQGKNDEFFGDSGSDESIQGCEGKVAVGLADACVGVGYERPDRPVPK